MAIPCPSCGGLVSRKAPIDASVVVITRPRVCVTCSHQFTAPLPRWVGLVALLFSTLLLIAVAYETFLAQPDWPMRLTWRGRLAVLVTAGVVAVPGVAVLRGEVGGAPFARITDQDLRQRGKEFRARHPVAKYLDILVAIVILVLILFWLFR